MCRADLRSPHLRPAPCQVRVGYGGDEVIEAARHYVGLDLLYPFFWGARDGKLLSDLGRGQLQRPADVPRAEGLHDGSNALVVDAMTLDQLAGHRRDIERHH